MSIINDSTKHFHEERVLDISGLSADEREQFTEELEQGNWHIQLAHEGTYHIYRPVDIEATARAIALSIEKDISDRRGLRQEWEQIDEEIQDEIRARWADRIKGILLSCDTAPKADD